MSIRAWLEENKGRYKTKLELRDACVKALGVDKESVINRLTDVWEGRIPTMGVQRASRPVAAAVETRTVTRDELVSALERQLREKDRLMEDYRKDHGALELFFAKVGAAVERVKAHPMEYKSGGKKCVVNSPCVAVMHVTDGHMGAVQGAFEIEGFGEFNPEICEKRQLMFASKIVDWVSVNRHAYTIDELRVLVTGDLISGDIHEELRVTNAFPVPEQVVRAARVLAEQIRFVAPHFKRVVVDFVTEDNHGRLTAKPQMKEAGLNSFNYLVGYLAKTMVENVSNVEFNMYPLYEAVVQVCGRRYLLCHGHGVMGWAGFPWYGVERKVGKEATRRMNAPDIYKFHKVVGGHWHTPICTPLYWFGGSVSGTDAYDHKNGRHSLPSQAGWMIHPKWGEFGRTDFQL